MYSSWDIKRALDSVADYMVAIDDDSKTLIRTPAAYEAWRKKLISASPPDVPPSTLPQPFSPERGSGQGTVLSPTAWIAFFDMLMRSLGNVEHDNVLIKRSLE